jgi:hypothetical protein
MSRLLEYKLFNKNITYWFLLIRRPIWRKYPLVQYNPIVFPKVYRLASCFKTKIISPHKGGLTGAYWCMA